jgi:hypothetical protein
VNRRQVILATLASLSLSRLRIAEAANAWGIPWMQSPAITIWSTGGDSRLPLVNDAVAFWNRIFTELGSGFRLGAVGAAPGTIPPGELKALSDTILSQSGATPMPEFLRGMPGQIVVALSDGDFVSFTARWMAQATALVAIKSDHSYPLTLLNVARNVIAHELGHAIGLGHNSDPTMLMCGRPAPCRPDVFASPSPRYFPLTAEERAALLWIYPASWQPR